MFLFLDFMLYLKVYAEQSKWCHASLKFLQIRFKDTKVIHSLLDYCEGLYQTLFLSQLDFHTPFFFFSTFIHEIIVFMYDHPTCHLCDNSLQLSTK